MSQLCKNAFGIEFDLDAEIERVRADEREKVIEEIKSKCSREYQAWSDDTVCKIWLSDLEQICSTKQ